ncbi:G-D-S-L family lipolytic protein [Muricauda sp. JGD-17]|uniref:G-D-S-L family lipolytic protein n=1 Tax=Flagellimonas ochracea TaxID=2696472 RepID=A0A964T8W9_9FLAO|nr:GDSL-type esterase/lipase family protein [Allomuricauda ochracea]NAY90388.1 G-D-S-L family lipolytic protein [Allomuricauda ochracea]
MKRLLVLLIVLPVLSQAQDPERFAEEIVEIQHKNDSIWDSSRPVVVFTGSSSVRLWEDLQMRFPEHQILNTGFGGSQFSDLEHYLNPLVLKYGPARIFIYEGDNDISDKKRPGRILKTTKRIIQKLQMQLSNPEIVLISPKPSIARWRLRGKYRRLNRRLAKFAANTQGVRFADVWHPMLHNRKLKPNLFIDDGLHMNTMGYDIWYDVLKEFVDDAK